MVFEKGESQERRAETFSLCFKPRIEIEVHHEPHLSEKPNYQTSGEIAERAVLQKSGWMEEGSGEALTPLMPNVKRNKDNHLDSFLEEKMMLNVTKVRQEGNFGYRFGEGCDNQRNKVGKWKETNRTKEDGITNPSNEF